MEESPENLPYHCKNLFEKKMILYNFQFQNHRIERMWVEFNLRVNYPIKHVLNSLVENELLNNIEDDITKYSISWVAQRVCHSGCRNFIDSWNSHFVRGTINEPINDY